MLNSNDFSKCAIFFEVWIFRPGKFGNLINLAVFQTACFSLVLGFKIRSKYISLPIRLLVSPIPLPISLLIRLPIPPPFRRPFRRPFACYTRHGKYLQLYSIYTDLQMRLFVLLLIAHVRVYINLIF